MSRLIAATLIALSGGILGSTAQADVLDLRSEDGAAMQVDTAKVQGCEMVFDSSGAAFEICRLEKIELRPPQSTRARPGQAASSDRATVVYVKATE